MKTPICGYRSILITGSILIMQLFVYAQKLPNKQEISLRAPTNMKIDGDADEWNNQYYAYNKSTEVFYTISNNDENIYLIVHATKSRIIEKLIEGGVTFTVSTSEKKTDDKNVTVLFPLISMADCRNILSGAGKHVSDEDILRNGNPYTRDSLITKKIASIGMTNDELAVKLKEIKVAGISSVIDTVAGITEKTKYYRWLPLHKHNFRIISTANKDGIKAMAKFDKYGELTYELCLPIRYLKSADNSSTKFLYNIKLNSRGADERPNDIIVYGGVPPNRYIQNMDLESDTDFWAEYILAKKP